ncbi:hypothetical protein SVIOM74S_09733 [Streptomyces violarus]
MRAAFYERGSGSEAEAVQHWRMVRPADRRGAREAVAQAGRGGAEPGLAVLMSGR